MKKILKKALPLVLTALCMQAHAYSEDICYADNNNVDIKKVKNCWDMQCKDDDASGACVVGGITLYLKTTLLANPEEPSAARSILHFDQLWMMARAAGLSLQDALVVASYSEATDKGTYTEHNINPMLNYTTASIPGVNRNNIAGGGPWFHFVPRSGDPATAPHTDDGSLSYNPASSLPFGPYELPLTHIRNWAFGKIPVLCAFAITNPDGSCNTSADIFVSYAAIGPTSIPEHYYLGPVAINSASNPDPNTAYSGTLMGLGIYLHSLGDRVSHYKCSEYSFITEPTPKHYALSFPEDRCGQIEHGLMHYTETGHAPVPARSTLTQDYYFNEIVQWLALHPQYRSHPPLVMSAGSVPIDFDQLKARITYAIGQGGAAERLSALCNAALVFGLGWHDGNTQCDYSSTY